MTSHDDINTWPIAFVFGSIIVFALFFALPALRFKQPILEPPVIEIDFAQWREPVPAPKVQAPPPKPAPKPKPKTKPLPIIQQPRPEPKKVELPVVREPVIPEQQTPQERQPAKPPPVTPAVSSPLTVTAPAKPAEQVNEDLPVPLFQLTSMPRFVHKVEPQYPASMRALGREARVRLEVLIDRKGTVRKVTILQSGGAAFDEAAKSALLASTFIPGNIEGKPVAVLLRIPISFRLK
jgi:protein TonB